MRMLLLISAVVLLSSPSIAAPHHKPEDNLNHLLDLADKYNTTLTQEYFVEDVSQLAEGRNMCEDKFFCKVYEILHKGQQRKEEKEIVRNLERITKGKNLNCTQLLQNVTPSPCSKPIPELLGHLKHCIQHRNLNGANNSD